MKISILGSKKFDTLEYHLHDSLAFLGHQVHHVDAVDVVKIPMKYNYWAQKLSVTYDLYIFNKLAEKIIDNKPELIICTYRYIHPDFVKKIKKNLPNTKIIHINPDQLTTLERQQIFASPYDAWFTKDRFMLDFMKNKMKLNTFYLPEALNPRVHKPPLKDRLTLENEINIDVVAFGTMYPYRANLVKNLIDANIDIALFGVPDVRFPKPEIVKNFRNEYITGERKAEVLLGSKIVFNNFHYAEIESANVKYFEIAGIGAFQICDYKPVLHEYSKIPVENYTYKSIDEAIELINFYKNNREERYRISQEQRTHFLENHTYEHRMIEMLKIIF